MLNEKRFLITTSDEATWKLDCPIIFLAEWCCKYDRKQVWESLDFVVAEPYGLSVSQQDSDRDKILALEKKLFPFFCELINQYHHTNYSIKFWKIVLGHWFRLTLTQLLFRTKLIKQCLQNHNISGCISYSYDKYKITPTFTEEIIDDRLFEPWRENILNSKILNLLDETNFPIEYIQFNKNVKCNQNLERKNRSYKSKINLNLIKLYQNLSKKFVKNTDALIINTYLPLQEEIKLELSLGQIPQLWKYKDKISSYSQITNLKTDNDERDKLTKNFESGSNNYLEKIITKLLFQLLPKIYLEGLEELTKIVNNQPWPSSPKFIFTSNEFFGNDIFKLWSAFKTEKGTKYFIGQHGNNYGTKRNTAPRVEEIIPYKFITWGWTSQSSRFVPGFIFKNEKKKYKFNPEGGLLLIETCYTKHNSTYDERYQYLKYLDDQIKFVSCLTKDQRNKLTIRLMPEYLIARWAVKKRWFDFDPKLNIENGTANISKLISQNRLVIHSYDSTGMLETLSRNIPTISFWLNCYDHILDEAKPFYKLLVDVGIVHFSSESAAEKINEVWDNIDNWWNRSDVQEARKLYCAQYARNSNNPVSELKEILLS
jgi:putative transferase (TIGR04331 family)